MDLRLLRLIFSLLLVVAITPLLGGCDNNSSSDDDDDDDDPPPAAVVRSIEFAGVPTPVTDAEKRQILASPTVEIDGEEHEIGFHTILRSGDQRGEGVFGKIYDYWGNPILQADLSSTISNDNDHSTLLDVWGKLFMVSQFESRPAAFYISELTQDEDTGELAAVDTKPIDFSAVYGGWVHCAGMRTPWKSHLGSEEYEPDARMCDPVTGLKNPDGGNYYGAMAAYFGGDHTQLNPYNYGYVVEVEVVGPHMGGGTFASNVSVEKHYCMGRVALELAYVMPDRKTVYLTDDGTMVGLFKFVADTAGDLTSGTLYAARMKQTSAADGGSFTVEWIALGHASDSEIRSLIDNGGAGGGKITFADIFDAVEPSEHPTTGAYSVPAGYTGVSHGHSSQVGGTYNEGLKLMPGMAKAAAFLETRRYAALMGATMEFRKMEGVTFNPDDRKLYIAMSEVSKGMEENTDGLTSSLEAFSNDDIRLPQNKAGTVYELDVDGNYSATAMRGLVSGTPTTYATGPYVGNTADVNGIANPDNVTYMPGFGTLIIGEDTGSGHQNDVIWSYNLETEELTRIQTTPYGSETTSPYWYPDINGWGYLMSVIQHPYGESDKDAVEPGSAERRAYTGYVGPFPMNISGTPTTPSGQPLEFVGVPTPVTDDEKRAILASPTVSVDGTVYDIGFHTILRSGDQRGEGVFGKIYDIDGDPILQADLSSTVSNDNDHSTLLDVFGKVFMVSQFESRPAAFYISELDQNPSTGELTAVDTKPIDFSAVYGGWVHCAGMRTPWKSHLGSEEYEPDARMCDPVTGLKDPDGGNYYGAMAAYFKGDHTRLNPYNYGYVVEVEVTGANMGTGTFASNVSVEKHYCMGRVALELAYVMPNRKTAYLTDDGTMVGLFKFVADTAGDLSAGTLYVAKMTQASASDGGSFTISWIELGHASNSEIRALIDAGGAGGTKITFADIFDAVEPTEDPVTGAYSVPAGYTGVSHGHSSQVGGTYNEGLKLMPGMAKAAAFLETRRYAAYMGGTMEFRKMEGITFDPDGHKLYLAMSEVSKGMEENTDGLASSLEAFSTDDIRLPQNKAGTVYELDVDGSYSATAMRGLVSGTPTTYGAGSPYAGNSADVNGIANPDNVTFIVGYNTLIIGEDTGSGHQNDVIWSYNLSTRQLTRIQTTPYGSETTSPYWYPNINGFAYLMSVIQHPYGESDKDAVEPGSAERRAYTGYVGPFPAMD